jgi:AcrR family transcriptional regulator
MPNDDRTRPYRKRKRARQEEETRRRITEAVVELHRTVGPARTRVIEVAELAGVSRMTVYNHFPTEGDLVAACSAHWSAENPFPDPDAWGRIQDPEARLLAALGALYRWYAGTEDMMSNVLRDAPLVEPLGAIVDAGWTPYLEGIVDRLAVGWQVESDEREALRAALRVAVDFQTWRLLADGVGSAAPGLAARLVMRGFGSCQGGR